MSRLYTYVGIIFLILVGVRCSVEQNNVTSNVYHNLTAHFNGYYYAREKTREVENVILKSLDDDHNQVLRLFPKLDTTLAKSYAKDTEEIIKMASISIQRHPNSKWVDDNYIQVGLARLYSCDFLNATQTFKYVNTKSRNKDVRHVALIHLARTFTENVEYDKAEETFRFLEKEDLSKTNSKNLFLEKAYHYQVRNDYDNMVRNLALADSLLVRADRKGRIYFIVGQVYQKLGFGSEAYNYYRKCLGTNPEYEIDFYARLNMAQVARLDDSKDVRTVRKQFMKLLADVKNQEFQDKIYFEFGEFERKQGHLQEAIDNYKLSAHAGKNKRIQGNAYLRIGELNFDSLKKYSLAKAYYDSAIAALPKEFEDYSIIKKRQEVLGEFVTYTETIQLQDSLLYLSTLDSATARNKIDSAIAFKAKKTEVGKKKKKKNSGSLASGNNQNNPFFQTETNTTSDWYFGNPSAIALGESEFQRIWGNIALEDNWRRSNKTVAVSMATDQAIVTENTKEGPATEEKKESVDEVAKLLKQLPRTEQQKKEALAKIEEAYFKLADLYFLKLNERENAFASYEKLLDRFPDSEYSAEVLYKLYLISREKNDGKAEEFVELLKSKHPSSTFTKILINPDYLKETSVAAEKQKLIYKQAYTSYQAGRLREAQEKITQALNLGETGFTTQLELLEILITGKTEDITKYQFELGEFIGKYPDGSLKPYAENLLASSKAFQEKMERAKGIRFSNIPSEPHRFVLVYRNTNKISDKISEAIEIFNKAAFRDRKLSTTNLVFHDDFVLTIVTDFPDRLSSVSYFDKFMAELSTNKTFASHKFDTFVITKNNFDIFYRTKALDEYLTFFDRNYKKENQ
jgi:tetratricopeptide (TPR) repeat protein